jgi:hypothetical protein
LPGVIDVAVRAFMESGCALLIGTVDCAGMPHASRGWGLDVEDPVAGRVRIVLAGDDPVTVANLRSTGRLAVTGTDIATLRSVQAKGHVLSLSPATPADRRRARRYCEAFFGDIERVDATPSVLVERLVPPDFEACVAVLDEWYDQTPGPGAGCRVSGRPT